MRASGGVLMDRSSAIPASTAGGSMAMEPLKDVRDSSSSSETTTRLRSVDSSSSLSSTVYEDDADSPVPPSSATSNTVPPTVGMPPSSSTNQPPNKLTSTNPLGFEASNFFRFADFGANATNRDDFFSSPELLDNHEIPTTVSPSNNQSTHEDPDDAEALDVVAPTPALPRAITHPRMHVVNRRKNSIEMFLSQSPSQALGGGFLKMALDDDEDDHHSANRPHHHSANQPTPPPDLRLEATTTMTTTTNDATAKSGVHHVGTAATPSPYGYLLSHSPPAVDTDDEWSSTSSQEMLSSSVSASAYYYAESQAALNHSAQPQASYGGYGIAEPFAYGARELQHHQSWTSTPGYGSSSLSGAAVPSPYQQHQSSNASRYAQASMHPYQPQQHQQLGYHTPHHTQRTPRHHGYARSQSMYATPNAGSRMGMMDASPPPSNGGMYGGAKQCKFFLQGHCRMGNKCKFAHGHQTPAIVPSPYGHHHQQPHHQLHHTQPQQQLHHTQSFRLAQPSLASSPHHQQHQDFDGAYLTRGGGSSASTSNNNHTRSTYRNGGGGGGGGPSGADMHLPPQHSHPASIGSTSGDEVLTEDAVLGRVFAMSKDQNGCRLLQEQLEFYDDRKPLCDVIYTEAMDHLAEMMVDPFGNYLFQKLLERARPLQRLEMVRRVSSHLVAAALNLHGTRSVQKVVEVCATSAQVVELDSDGRESRRVNLPDLIVDALKDDAVRLCIDSNGNHVIQRALQFMKPAYTQFVFDAVAKECTTVGTHRHGCCVLQRCLDAANDEQKRDVITQVEKQAMKLMQDPYGNYVVQYVLDSCTADEAYGVISKPLGNVFELSIQKFSSNVIEKCLEKAPPSLLTQYVEEITRCPKMHKMLQDQFANYVVQRALCVAAEDQCMTLVTAIRPHLPAMKNTSGGRRITARILKRFPHMDLSLDLGFAPAGDAVYGAGYMHQDLQGYQLHPQPEYGASSSPYDAAFGMRLHPHDRM